LLPRVQIKMSKEDATTEVSGPKAKAWLDKLETHSETMCAGLRTGHGINAVPLHIVWSSQACSAPAAAAFKERCQLVVNTACMLEYWVPRVKAFVVTEELAKLGFVAAAAGGAG
jgi:hypothetical protein